MTDKPTGGSAFPHSDPVRGAFSGMSLRDYFAGQALAGLCATGESDTPSAYAQVAYAMADAMFAERSKT